MIIETLEGEDNSHNRNISRLMAKYENIDTEMIKNIYQSIMSRYSNVSVRRFVPIFVFKEVEDKLKNK